ncbi:MAG TPA: hypothetical protein G4O05_07230, partial [Caldilineae bacterium]|nr:hypothetical protein [Caldilineae bacterium]
MSSATSSFLKFVGGVTLGAAIGVGIYLVVTSDSEEGVIHGIKETISHALEEGRRAAEQRRLELERELGFSLEEPLTPALQTATPESSPPDSTPVES